jgi:L-amino acid N-acyltransferase YncA
MSIATRSADQSDADAIAGIYNQGIEDRGATFETTPRTPAEMVSKIALGDGYPLLVAEDDGVVVGWAGLSEYRPRACYDGIAEFSIYLDRAARGRGIGRVLLTALVEAAREHGFWKLVSRVFPFNSASLGLCRSCGFREVGTYEKHGRLDGQWLDVVIVERLIPENLAVAIENEPAGVKPNVMH